MSLEAPRSGTSHDRSSSDRIARRRRSPSGHATLSLPGGAEGIGFDDLVFAAELHRVLVPAGRTGRVDLVEPGSNRVDSVEGFSRTAGRTHGHGDGVTSADAGGGLVFATDRTERTVAVVDPAAKRIVAQARLRLADGYPAP